MSKPESEHFKHLDLCFNIMLAKYSTKPHLALCSTKWRGPAYLQKSAFVILAFYLH